MIETSVQNILTASVSTKKENKNMTAFTGDIQILLYTEEENFSVCRDFYQTLLGQKPYYSWNESAQDLSLIHI